MLNPSDLPGFDPTFEPPGLSARQTAPPVGFNPAGDGGVGEASSPSGLARVAQILQIALPALATVYSLKKGSGLDSFANAYIGGIDRQKALEDRDRQRQIQEDGLRRQIAYQAAREAREQRMESATLERYTLERQRVEQEAQRARESALLARLKAALDNAAKDPAFMAKVNDMGPENFSVPGLNFSLREAFDKLGIVRDPDGKYHYGAPPKVEDPKLITGVGPKGRPVRVKDVEGAAVYEKPDKPEKADKRTTRSFIWKDDDPNSDTWGQSFRIVEDENGNEISRRRLVGTNPVASHQPAKSPTKVGRFIIEPE